MNVFSKLAKLFRNLLTIDVRIEELRNDITELRYAIDKLDERIDHVNLRVDKIYELLVKLNNSKK